jgi:hypothetical protein
MVRSSTGRRMSGDDEVWLVKGLLVLSILAERNRDKIG